MHNKLNRTHSFLKRNSILIDKNECLKISDFWLKDLFEIKIHTVIDVKKNQILDDELKDVEFAIGFLKKMLLGNESLNDNKIYQCWPESLKIFIQQITENKINSLEDILVI